MRLVTCSLLTVALTSASLPSSAGYLSDNYTVPVVARNSGVAGSSWRTEVCISNLQSFSLNVVLRLFQDGSTDTAQILVGPFVTACSEDFLSELFGLSEYQGGLLVQAAPPPENPSGMALNFALSVRVYNQTENGSYGLSVDPVTRPPTLNEEKVGLSHAASGLHIFGVVGVSGFRSSVGVCNPEDEPVEVSISVKNLGGITVWERNGWVPARSQVQFLLPQSLGVINGMAAFLNKGTSTAEYPTVYPYATVTDNATGDGRFINAGQNWGWAATTIKNSGREAPEANGAPDR
jgi:hypothetical protein